MILYHGNEIGNGFWKDLTQKNEIIVLVSIFGFVIT